jgi:hypothetical protein
VEVWEDLVVEDVSLTAIGFSVFGGSASKQMGSFLEQPIRDSKTTSAVATRVGGGLTGDEMQKMKL